MFCLKHMYLLLVCLMWIKIKFFILLQIVLFSRIIDDRRGPNEKSEPKTNQVVIIMYRNVHIHKILYTFK